MVDRARAVHAARDDNAAGGDSAGVRVPPPVIYLAGFLAAVGAEALLPTPSLPLPLAVAIGAAGLVAWLALDPLAMRKFHQAGTAVVPNRPATALVRHGPYRLSRNPMYVGMLILLAAGGLALGVLWVLAAVPPVALVVDRFVIRREEAYLQRRFGAAYSAYRADVRRWL